MNESNFLHKIYEKKEFYENLKDTKKTINFKGTKSLCFINCENLYCIIRGKVTNIFIQNCKNCDFFIENVYAKIEILRSSDLFIEVTSPSETPITIQADIAHSIEMEINHPCQIQTVSCIDIEINSIDIPCSMFNDVKNFEII